MSQTTFLEERGNVNLENLSRGTVIALVLQIAGMALSYLVQVFLGGV